MKRLIINADDFGLSKKFNRGILELIDRGIATSTTVMTNQKFVEAKKILARKNISVGLHLELSPKTSLREIESQVRKFQKLFGRLPTHLDGHKHCHLLPKNLPLVLKIAKKYKLPVRSRFSEDRKTIQSAGLKTPDCYISWHPKRKQRFLENIRGAKRDATEIVCHPGYFDAKSTSSYNKQRERELEILKSRNFKKAVGNFEMISYAQI